MAALIFLLLNLGASLFKSKSRLEAENAALRQQLIVLQRKVRGRVQFTNSDRLFFIQPSLAALVRAILKTSSIGGIFGDFRPKGAGQLGASRGIMVLSSAATHSQSSPGFIFKI